MPFFKHHRALAAVFVSSLASSAGHAASVCYQPHCEGDGRRDWAFEVGVAMITSNDIADFFIPGTHIERYQEPDGGLIYSFTATRLLGNLKLEIGEHTFTPQLEVPLTLEVVDEDSRSPFLDFNASFAVRWIDFPWNRVVKTSFATGIGLSYSSRIYLADIDRHPDEDRSHMKFNWPIQLTLALPQYPEHELMFFIAHQSGGETFDSGGVNSIGFGYRRDF